MEALKGYSIQKDAHKTAPHGAAHIWVSQAQMIVLRAFMATVEKFHRQNPHLEYDLIKGPLFVNKRLGKYKSGKKTLDTSIISELADVGHLTAYDFRRMYATYVGSSKSLIFRQYGALAASHR